MDRAENPLLIVQGTADEVSPAEWPEDTRRAFEAGGKEVEVVMIDGADHGFEPARDEAWSVILEFLETHLAP